MPASVLIDRTNTDAAAAAAASSRPQAFGPGIGSEPQDPQSSSSSSSAGEPSLHQSAGDSFALQLANSGKPPGCAIMAPGSSPLLGRCGQETSPNLGPPVALTPNRKSMNMTECVHVASSEHVAEIVGRQGSKIKALRAKTNTYIKTPVRGEEPVFVVTGRKEDVAAAKKEILLIAEHFSQIRAGRANNNVGNRSPASVGFLSAGLPGHVTIHVRVPYRVVGLVVGPKGATIKRIQQDSQTYIVTPSRDREPIFEVTGLSENVEKARREIESYIALRTGTGLSDTGIYSSSNNTTSVLQSFGCNGGLDDVSRQDVNAQILLGSMLKPPPCNTLTPSVLASFNNTLNLSMATKSLVLTGSSAELSGGTYQGLLTSSKKDGLLPNYINTSGTSNEYSLCGSSKAYDKLMLPCCNNNMPVLASDFWSQINNMETPLLLDSLASLFPSTEEISALQNGSSVGDSGIHSIDGLNLTSLNLFSNNNSDVERIAKDNFGPMSVNGAAPAYIANIRSGSVGSASSNSPSVSPTDSVGSPSQRRRRCFVCGDGDIVAALVPCGHNLFCMECAQAILEKTEQLERRCPVCQQLASLAVRILS